MTVIIGTVKCDWHPVETTKFIFAAKYERELQLDCKPTGLINCVFRAIGIYMKMKKAPNTTILIDGSDIKGRAIVPHIHHLDYEIDTLYPNAL